MIFYGILTIVFGILVIVYPNLLTYLIGGFFIFMGINLLIFGGILGSKKSKKDYVQVGEYKIFRGK